MTVYPVKDVETAVRIVLDQNGVSDALVQFGDVDTLQLNEIIESKIVEGIKMVHSQAPAYLLDGGYNFGTSIYWKNNGTGWVLLPDDFMRLVVFEMDDWERAVFNALSIEDEEYKKQSSRFKGVRGNPQKPVCVLTFRPEGRVLEFYSCYNTDAMVSRASYIPYPFIAGDNTVRICRRCFDAVVYTIASLVLLTLKDTENSNLFSELAKTALI